MRDEHKTLGLKFCTLESHDLIYFYLHEIPYSSIVIDHIFDTFVVIESVEWDKWIHCVHFLIVYE